jgi:predicted metalloprotease
MKWRTGRRSSNIEDRRGEGGGGFGGASGGRPAARIGGGLTGIGIIALIAVFLLGGDPMQLLGDLLGGGQGAAQSVPQQPVPTQRQQNQTQNGTRSGGATDEQADFVSVVLADTEDTWTMLFKQYGSQYIAAPLVLFDEGGIQSACGFNTTASGPFYCPGDRKLYLDLSFFRELDRLGAPGDFAQAYVVGHEVAHHVQNITGLFAKTQQLQRRASKTQANAIQVLVELQADCYAGVWAHHAEQQRDLLERGDVEEGMQAAASIGDDRLMSNAGRAVRPESFTHGSSKQRVEWFKRGIVSGDIAQCDTFAEAGVKL